MLFVALCVVFGMTMIVKYLVYKRHMESFVENLPMLEPCYPLIGCALEFVGKSSAQIFSLTVESLKNQGTPCKTWMGPLLAITVDKPEDVKAVLFSSNCLDKPYLYRFLPSTYGLLTAATGTSWKPIRKLLNPSFNLKILQSFVPIFNEKTNIMLSNLNAAVGNKNFDVSPYVFACTLDMVCATTMGFNGDVQREKNEPFSTSIETVCQIVAKRFITFWAHPNFIFRWTNLYKAQKEHCDVIDKLTGRVRCEKKEEYYANNKDIIAGQQQQSADDADSDIPFKTPQILIDQLFRLFHAGKFSEQVVKEQIETVIIAGNETSGLTISYAILMLAMHPDIQERAFEELKSVYDSPDEYSSYERIQQLTYLDCVLKEVMRMFPVAPFIVRCCIANTKLRTFTIPKDALVMVSLYNLHRREDIWGVDADVFNPDHFSPEQSIGRDPFAFLPFGGGPRNCIGLQYAMISLKVMMAGILRKYRFTTDLKMEELVLKFELTLKLGNRYLVNMERREWPAYTE